MQERYAGREVVGIHGDGIIREGTRGPFDGLSGMHALKEFNRRRIAKGGIILSEHPFGVKANPTRLVARCRLQVALTRSVIVAQCPIISGTMYAVQFAQRNDSDSSGWKNDVYAVQYDTQNELNSGNKFLLDYNLALSIKLGQEIALGPDNKLMVT